MTMIEHPDGMREWRVDGKRHRIDGPAIERADGSRSWWVDGKRHRIDGPAVERADGTREWWVDGKLHRTDGPAVVRADGLREWWVDGVLLDIYWEDLGCFNPRTREEALKRLDRKPRPYARDLYLADINRMFPEES